MFDMIYILKKLEGFFDLFRDRTIRSSIRRISFFAQWLEGRRR